MLQSSSRFLHLHVGNMQSSGSATRPDQKFSPAVHFAEPELEIPAQGKRSECLTYLLLGFVRCLKDTGAGLESGLSFRFFFFVSAEPAYLRTYKLITNITFSTAMCGRSRQHAYDKIEALDSL